MLLRFGCSNHLSIREFQEISLLAPTKLSKKKDNLLEVAGSKFKALRSSAIYGANASGKSNFIKSIVFMRHMVMNSHARFLPDQEINNTTFMLDNESLAAPSQFECDFVNEGIRFSYGFTILNHKILNEYLYAFPQGHKQTWFSRDEGDQKNKKFYFGSQLKGRNALISDLTRSNSLFLSAAAQQNHEQLAPVYGYFDRLISSNIAFGEHPQSMITDMLEGNRRKWVLEFLRGADTGIFDASVQTRDVPEEIKRFEELLTSSWKKSDLNTKSTLELKVDNREISFGHLSNSNSLVFLPYAAESAGTRRMLELLASMIHSLDRGGLAVIDEIDASIHTLVASKLVDLFNKSEINTKSAQLLFTTHDTNLLCNGTMRREEIWFAEKNSKGETHIYPLSDYQLREGDNVEKGYLQGRFGAIPFFGNIGDLETTE